MNQKSKAILEFIVHHHRKEGAPPTVREIGEAFRIRSTNGVCYYLDLLEKAGAIVRKRGLARGIELHPDLASAAPELTSLTGLPILGQIAAGGPILSEENIEGVLNADRLGDTSATFALRVAGDSMRDAGILDGDFVLVKPEPHPRKGAIVVAMIGDETTVKRFLPERGRIFLSPENPDYEPIVVTPTSPDFKIVGKVVGVYREFRS